MTVKELIAELNRFDPDAKVFVACEGYTNFDPERNDYYESDETHLEEKNGRLYIADSCYISDED